MKKITHLLILFLFFTTEIFAQVSIGTGTDRQQGLPFDPGYQRSYTQSIYKAAEINTSGEITSLKWYFSGTSTLPNSQDLVIYLGHTTKNVFSSTTDWENVANLTQVYAGGIPVSGTGWVTITFDTPFNYNGTSNLIVAVNEKMANSDSYTEDFYNSAVVGNRSIYSNSNTLVVTAPPSGSLAAFIPNVIFEGIEQSCANPSAPVLTDLQDNTASFSWDTMGTENSWQVLINPSTAAEPTATTAGISVIGNTEYTDSGLLPSTNYKFYVRSDCGSEFSGWIGPVAFMTQCAPVSEFNEGFDLSTANLPSCWKKLGTNGSLYPQSDQIAASSPNALYIYNSSTIDRSVLAMPFVNNASDATHRLKFKARGSYNTGGIVEVGYLTNILDASSFVSLQSFTITSTAIYDNFIAELGIDPQSNNLALRHTGVPANPVLIDNIVWEPIPGCSDVLNLAAISVFDTNASISWDSGDEASWEYAYGTSTATNPNNLTAVSVSEAQATINSLSASTLYKVWVRSTCGTGNYGSWNGPISFTTQCAPVSEISESFDASTALPACWRRVGGNGSANVQSVAGTPTAPNAMNLSNTTPNGATQLTVLALPYVNNLGTGTHRLRFKARGASAAGGNIEVGYLTNILNPSSFVSFQSFTINSATTFQTFIVEPETGEFTGNLAFRHSGIPSSPVLIDDVIWEALPQCSDINDLAYSNLRSNSVDLSWATEGSETNWQYAIGASTVTNPSALTPVGVTGNTEAFITSLQPSTVYKIWVRSNCGNGAYGAWAGPINITTQCNEIATYIEGFDASTASLPNCFKKVGTDGSIFIQNAGTGAFSAPNNINMYGAILSMPPVSNANAGTHRLKFKARGAYSAGGNSIIVGYLADTNGVITFVPIQTFTATSSTVYDTFSAELGTQPLSNTIAIKHTGENAIVLDDIVWELLPTCSDVYGIAHESLLSTSTTINWETNGSENAWEYVLGSSTDTAPGSLTAVSVNETSADLSGLNPATTYKIWVRSDCGSGSYGAWIGPFSFTTLCAPVAVNYTQDFSNFPPQCWERAAAGTSTTGPVGTAEGIWAADGFLNAGSTGAVKVNLYYINRIGWMVSPIFDLSTGQKNVSFNYAVTTWGETTPIAMGSDDTVTFLASEDGGNTWSEVVVFNTASNVPNSSQTYTYTPSTTSATVKFAFLATDGTVDDTQDYDFFIDNFKVEAALSTGEFDSNAFTFYPNPVKNTLSLSYNQDITSVAVFNLLGQQVLTQSVNANQAKIDMSTLTAGTYIVKVAAESQVKTIKVIKQ